MIAVPIRERRRRGETETLVTWARYGPSQSTLAHIVRPRGPLCRYGVEGGPLVQRHTADRRCIPCEKDATTTFGAAVTTALEASVPWALFADPDIYRIDDAVREVAEDEWTTAENPIRRGDRVLIWRGQGRGTQCGVVALGEVLSDPEETADHENPFWVTPPSVDDKRPRVRVHYVVPPRLPLWLSDNEPLLAGLAVARARGGSVFQLSEDQWGAVLDAAGGWPRERVRATGAGETALAPIGAPYRPANENVEFADREPFEVDPKVIERGNRAHRVTQNELAEHLRLLGIEPRSPCPDDPDFDLGWMFNGTTFVAEVKSITDVNEETQLRLGLGQVLRYRHQLGSEGTGVGVLVGEREPRDASWEHLCQSLGVLLVWPPDFLGLPA